VFAYTIAFSVWWAYLLYAKNNIAFREKMELDKIHFQKINNPNSTFESTLAYQRSLEKYNRQRLMIVTEGAVFIILLFIGLMQVRRVFAKELALASLQRNFLLSISHELKSPLASIKASLQTFEKKNLEEDKKRKLIYNSLSDIERLENLVDNILFAAKIERDEHGLVKEELDISSICESTLKRFYSNKKNITVLAEIEPGIFLQTDKVGFASVVSNLVENAIKYSPENSTVKVCLKKQSEVVKLSVSDTGAGIPDDEKEKVFQKFYRIGNEETRKTKGTGLGLYIVKRFIELANGKIQVKDNIPTGTTFELEFAD
jgi:signal transduction histidine kinase